MEKTALFRSKKEWIIFFVLTTIIFVFSIFSEWRSYQELTDRKFYDINATVINQYTKNSKNGREYFVLRLESKNHGTFYTTSYEDLMDITNRSISLVVITDKINFKDYIRGFYAPSFRIKLLPTGEQSIYEKSVNFLKDQHETIDTKEIFSALFLAAPQSKSLRDKVTKYASAHLIALSGFHLGVLTVMINLIFGTIYRFFQKRYFPHRNIFIDMGVFTLVVLGFYLIFTGVVPSLLRAYVMLLFGIFLIYRHIKILSFTNLLIVVVFLIALFPKLALNVGFILSVTGVFYIFLFMHYYKDKSFWTQVIWVGIYVFIAMLPIVHFYFPMSAYTQLLAPIITAVFAPFFAVSLLLHFVGLGGIFDSFIQWGLDVDTKIWFVTTPPWLFFSYIALSILAIFHRYFHYLLLAFFVPWMIWHYGYMAIISP